MPRLYLQSVYRSVYIVILHVADLLYCSVARVILIERDDKQMWYICTKFSVYFNKTLGKIKAEHMNINHEIYNRSFYSRDGQILKSYVRNDIIVIIVIVLVGTMSLKLYNYDKLGNEILTHKKPTLMYSHWTRCTI